MLACQAVKILSTEEMFYFLYFIYLTLQFLIAEFISEPISVRIKPEVVRTKTNSDASLECKVSGHPIEVVYWMHDARMLKSNERIKLSDDGLRLHIKSAQKDDQGIYQCFASNTRDQAYGVADFVINGKKRGFSNFFLYLLCWAIHIAYYNRAN